MLVAPAIHQTKTYHKKNSDGFDGPPKCSRPESVFLVPSIKQSLSTGIVSRVTKRTRRYLTNQTFDMLEPDC